MNDRGVSVTVNYVMGLAIATLLMSGLLFASGTMIQDRQESAIRGELDVVGQRLAAGLMTADRLVQSGGDEVTVRLSMPQRVAGSSFEVAINPSPSGSHLLLESHNPTTTVNVSFVNRTSVEPTTVSGGDVRVVLAADGDLEVESA